MFSHKSYLLLNDLAKEGVNIPFLTKYGYELSHCNYSFQKGIDEKGQVQSRARGGIIQLGLLGVPSNEIIEWSVKPRKYIDGAVVFCDTEGNALEKIYFTSAACTSMDITYIRTGSSYITCNLILSTKEMKVGNVAYTSEWSNI